MTWRTKADRLELATGAKCFSSTDTGRKADPVRHAPSVECGCPLALARSEMGYFFSRGTNSTGMRLSSWKTRMRRRRGHQS